jgi:hypothetical protein
MSVGHARRRHRLGGGCVLSTLTRRTRGLCGLSGDLHCERNGGGEDDR